CQQYHSLPYSF
nr:immunoglobulin light chain junction region [Macaca mulatta]